MYLMHEQVSSGTKVHLRPDFLSVDLRDFFFRFRVVETKQKNSENDQLNGHFLELFFHFQSFLISKTSMVNQQSVLNL